MDKNNPYSLVPKEETRQHIKLSKYWGDQMSIVALINELQLYVIPITKDDNGFFSIPVIEFSNDKWNNFMFLYHKEYHYELLSFTYNYYKKYTKILAKHIKTHTMRKRVNSHIKVIETVKTLNQE